MDTNPSEICPCCHNVVGKNDPLKADPRFRPAKYPPTGEIMHKTCVRALMREAEIERQQRMDYND